MLVLVAVIGFPLVFDTQPRPVAVDVAIQIPDRNKVKPLAVPSAATDAAPSVAGPVVAASAPARAASSPAVAASVPSTQVSARASLDAREEIVAPGSEKKAEKPSVKSPESAIHSEAKTSPAAAPKPEPKPEPKAETKPPAAHPADDGRRAQALLEGKETAPAPKAAASDTGRFIVQVGAFADATKARETRLKVEKAGLTTYTHIAETAEGKRIRVRVGPFTNRAEAEKAAARIRGLDLPAAILTL
ncbi:SPOR domain-containing protein [Candidatus Skiveiella danica]|uniref:SPOR domain-containing protein n=1 Tax=Candidatus Skiveiella danica TaxID=3386177 RepID=UPI0039B98859